ncbi:hypothetical protein DY000_02015825 [Brassica cretica]|nr:hypothetical protein DY000_02015825 [Brassica cretica]
MAPLWSRNLRGVSEGIVPSGMVGTVDVSRPVSFAGEAVAKLVMGIPRRFRWVTFLVSREALRHSHVWGNTVRSSVSVIYDEYQKVKTRKRRLSYTPPPRLARAALSAGGLSSISSTSAEIMPNWDLLVVADEGVAGEARRSLESRRRVSSSPVLIWRVWPPIGESLPGCIPEICYRVAILGGTLF